MKSIKLEQTTLDTCVNEAQHDRILIIRNGAPVALVVGIEGMDDEQAELGVSDAFWGMIQERRTQATLSRAALEEILASADGSAQSPAT